MNLRMLRMISDDSVLDRWRLGRHDGMVMAAVVHAVVVDAVTSLRAEEIKIVLYKGRCSQTF